MSHPAPRLGDRSLFPTLRDRVYLNHAAISPLSEPVRDAVGAVVDSYAAHGMGALSTWLPQRERLKAQLARLIGADDDEIGLVANTTTGVVDIAMGLPWEPGDGVVVFEGEFPTNVTPWQQASQVFHLRLHSLPLDGFGDGSGDGLARLESVLRGGKVRLVAVSAVQFQTGLCMPLEALARLAHAHGAQLFVDAIQAVGVVPVDVHALGVDYLAAGSHKWLMGTEGCAFLYVARQHGTSLVPRTAGWLSHENGLDFLFEGPGHLRYDRPLRARADVFEVGAPNTVGLAALEASVGLLEQLGVGAIFRHVQGWHDAVEPALVALGLRSLRAVDPAARSGILAFEPPRGVQDVALLAAVRARGVAITNPDGRLRLAPHWPNAHHEASVVADAFRDSLHELGL